eukprot:33246-Eustigmatos_ZCMA.PRE.1
MIGLLHVALTGSALKPERREKRDRNKMRQRFWELGGSRMGEAMGIKAEPSAETEEEKGGVADSEYDYRKDNKFSDHFKGLKKE